MFTISRVRVVVKRIFPIYSISCGNTGIWRGGAPLRHPSAFAGDLVKSLTRFRPKALIIPRSSKLVVAQPAPVVKPQVPVGATSSNR